MSTRFCFLSVGGENTIYQDLIFWFKLILHTDDRIVFCREFAPSLKKSQWLPVTVGRGFSSFKEAFKTFYDMPLPLSQPPLAL